MIFPYRSVLYLPGSKSRVLEKARALKADALIFDLEDAVPPGEKETARDLVRDAIKEGGYGKRKLLVRINGFKTPWAEGDLQMALDLAPDGIVLPKVESGQIIKDVSQKLPSEKTKIWAMMETPKAVLRAEEIASSSGELEGFIIGTNDLAKELRAVDTKAREPLLASLAIFLAAARAYNKVCVDGVYNAFQDGKGLRKECVQGLNMGMDGKTLIHPAQIEVANEVFAPTQDAVDLSKRQIQAYEDAIARGEAVAVVDGRIVENLHVDNAMRILALNSVIRSMAQQ